MTTNDISLSDLEDFVVARLKAYGVEKYVFSYNRIYVEVYWASQDLRQNLTPDQLSEVAQNVSCKTCLLAPNGAPNKLPICPLPEIEEEFLSDLRNGKLRGWGDVGAWILNRAAPTKPNIDVPTPIANAIWGLTKEFIFHHANAHFEHKGGEQ